MDIERSLIELPLCGTPYRMTLGNWNSWKHFSLNLKPMFDHNSKIACHVDDCNHRMDFDNVEVVGREPHYHQRLFLEAWMSVKDRNAGNDHMVIPEVYKCLART